MKQYYVYILKCADDSYYTGITNDLTKRVNQHSDGYDSKSYTYSRRPVSLVWHCCYTEVNYAIALEKQIKRWSRKKKEALISENWDALKTLAACKNDTHYSTHKK